MFIINANAQRSKLHNFEKSDEDYFYHPISAPYANYVGVTDSFGVQRYMHIDSLYSLISNIGNDSIIPGGVDSLCFIIMGDTTCVPVDSVVITNDPDSICFYDMGLLECLPYNGGIATIYTDDDALEEARTVYLDNKFLRFIQAGNLDGFQILPLSVQRMCAIQTSKTGTGSGVNCAALEINNTAISGVERNAYVRYLNGTNIFSMGEDLSINGFTFSDSVNLKNPVWRYFGGGGTSASDSLSFLKVAQFWKRVGINKLVPARQLDIVGTMNLMQTAATQNVFINGGNLTATGGGNVAIGGSSTGVSITSGAANVILGGGSTGQSLTTGSNNFIAGGGLPFLTIGGTNFAAGFNAGGTGTDINQSVFIGQTAGFGSTDPDSSVIIGQHAGVFSTGAAYRSNTIIGHKAGNGMTGSGNVLIGKSAGLGQNLTSRLIIENSSTTTPLIAGNFSSDSIRFYADARADQWRNQYTVDSANTSITLDFITSTNCLLMKLAGAKTVTLPNAQIPPGPTEGYRRGCWFRIVNNSSSGDITVVITGGSGDIISGNVTIMPQESATFEMADFDFWIQTGY